MKWPHFRGISIFFFALLGVWGVFDYFFLGTPKWVKFRIFLILPDLAALGGPQGPPQTGFGVAQDGPVEVLAVL